MVRFRVIRGSRLLLGIAVIILVTVLALLGFRIFAVRQAKPVGNANLVSETRFDEAKTAQVFASSNNPEGPIPATSESAIDIEVLSVSPSNDINRRVLIYHTHTHEAYEQDTEDPYDAIETWRTVDADHSVVRVGEELAEHLKQSGIEVVHDVTDCEGSQLSTAYTRSLTMLEGYADTPFDLYIDLHRDAYVEGEPLYVEGANGEQLAPLMLLIGNGNGFEQKPFYEQNLSFARALEQRVNQISPGLCKPVLVKDGRYNQHIGVHAVLVEVGHNRNTLRQALNSVPALSEAISALLQEQAERD